MGKNTSWKEDSESFGIAMRLVEKYSDKFGGLDLNKIRFVRDLAATGKKIGELRPCSFPYDIDSPYAYYIVINNTAWKRLSKSQHNLMIMHLLYGIAPKGTDESSANYARTRPYDVKDYTEIVEMAGGNYAWHELGMDVPDPLEDNNQNEEEKTL